MYRITEMEKKTLLETVTKALDYLADKDDSDVDELDLIDDMKWAQVILADATPVILEEELALIEGELHEADSSNP